MLSFGHRASGSWGWRSRSKEKLRNWRWIERREKGWSHVTSTRNTQRPKRSNWCARWRNETSGTGTLTSIRTKRTGWVVVLVWSNSWQSCLVFFCLVCSGAHQLGKTKDYLIRQPIRSWCSHIAWAGFFFMQDFSKRNEMFQALNPPTLSWYHAWGSLMKILPSQCVRFQQNWNQIIWNHFGPTSRSALFVLQ